MNMSLIQVISALAMVGATVALVLGYRRFLAINSDRRMRAMLVSAGLDPYLALSGETRTLMNEARKRCRNCATEGVCERWLKGREEGDNSFCPNASVFDSIVMRRRAA